MVHIPGPEAQLAPGTEGRQRSFSRSHHNWGARFGRHRDEHPRLEPTCLKQLETLAHRQVQLIEKHGYKAEHNFKKVMDLLRQQYNLNFRLVCEQCNGPHQHLYDEIDAPER